LDLRALSGQREVESVCALIAASGALERARQEALALVAQAKADLPRLPGRQRVALELVADGVVERYS